MLTRTEGALHIGNNDHLTCIDFASLNYVGGFLEITNNPVLTLASLPRLSQVYRHISFCQNSHSFLIPNGITSVLHKNSFSTFCILMDGTGTCEDVYDICP